MKEYHCDKCNKIYKTKSGLWKHQTAKHQYKVYQCDYCLNVLTRKDNLNRHIQTCKLNPLVISKCNSNNIEKKDEKDKIIEMLMNVIKNSNNLSNNNTMFDKIQQTVTTGNNNNVQTIQNNNCGNNINIVSFGNEDIMSALTNMEKTNVLEQRLDAIEFLIKYIHFNKDFPKFQNILIRKDPDNKINAYQYDSKHNAFTQTDSDILIHELMVHRTNDLCEIFNDHHDDVSKKTSKIINNLIAKMQTHCELSDSTFLSNKKDNISKFIQEKSKDVIHEHKKRFGKLKLKKIITSKKLNY